MFYLCDVVELISGFGADKGLLMVYLRRPEFFKKINDSKRNIERNQI